MSMHEITKVVVRDEFVGLVAEGLERELVLPEAHLWSILARDDLRVLALTKGILGFRIELGSPPAFIPAQKGSKFIARIHHPAVRETGTTKWDLDSVFGSAPG